MGSRYEIGFVSGAVGKRKSLTCLAAIAVGILTVFVAASGPVQVNTWKGTIKIQGGIRVVRNPAEPLFGDIVFDLVEDLTIGGEDDGHSYFYKNVEIAVDREGTIYVLDTAESRIQVFGDTGRFIRSIGRKGQGPGELGDFPGGLFIDTKGRICVTDNYRIQVFNRDGQVNDTITLTARLLTTSLTEGGGLVGKFQATGRESVEEEIALFERDGRKTSAYYRHSYPLLRAGNIRSTPSPFHNPGLFIQAWPGGCAVFGFSKDYRLHCLDGQGRTCLIIEKDEPPTPITEAEKRAYYRREYESSRKSHPRFPARKPMSMADVKKMNPLSDSYPYFMGLYADDEANIYVLRTAPLDPRKWTFREFDVFDGEGRYIAKIKMSPLPAVIKKGYVYEIRWDGDKGLFLIKRYRVRNWAGLGLD